MPSANKAKIKSALSAAFLVALISFSSLLLWINGAGAPSVSFANATVGVEIAESATDRKIGLGSYDHLPEDRGMLFIFERKASHGFWMEGMQFPIDIIWMDEKRRVVHIENNVSPLTYPKIFYPNLPAKYVLETNAGWAAEHNVRLGDIAHFQL